MEINLHNYEAFFLDYKEGNLSAALQKELFLFLEKYPHLYEELSAFENVTLDDLGAAEIFANKDSIRKSEFTTQDVIAYTEGIADTKTQKEIEILASQNKAFKREIDLYEAAVVAPDLNIKYKNKSALKKRGVVIALRSNYAFLRVAAAILLLFGLFFLISNLTSSDLKNEKVVADGSQNLKVKNQEPRVENQKLKTVNPEIANEKNQLAVNSGKPKVESKDAVVKKAEENKHLVKENMPEENKNIAINPVQTNTTITNNSVEPVVSTNTSAKNNGEESPATIKSYYNYRPDTEDEETPVVTASAAPAKKSFFQKLVNVAKNVNKMGLKNVNASGQGNSNTVSIGSLVLTETTSN